MTNGGQGPFMAKTEIEEEPTTAESRDPAKPRKKLPRGEVHIFDNWCKGCGLCIAFCPQEVLEANGEGHPVVAHPELCTACNWCYIHCPDLAIVVRKLDEAS
jgi:2-oxoglutarate ferredoxin oxidoreductase subunit delta